MSAHDVILCICRADCNRRTIYNSGRRNDLRVAHRCIRVVCPRTNNIIGFFAELLFKALRTGRRWVKGHTRVIDDGFGERTFRRSFAGSFAGDRTRSEQVRLPRAGGVRSGCCRAQHPSRPNCNVIYYEHIIEYIASGGTAAGCRRV